MLERLVEIGKSLRDARLRHEQLGLTAEEAAFYDALAGAEDLTVDPQIANIAKALVKSIREDLAVDWADRESTEAAIRRKIRRLLRQHEYKPPAAIAGGGVETSRTSTRASAVSSSPTADLGARSCQCQRRRLRRLIPRAPVQQTAAALRAAPAPLLEKERDALLNTAVPQLA